MTNRMAYSGVCANTDCHAVYTVSPHPETPAATVDRIAAGPEQWEAFADCFICGDSIDWNGNDYLPLTVR